MTLIADIELGAAKAELAAAKAEVERLRLTMDGIRGDAFAAINPANWQTGDCSIEAQRDCFEAALKAISDPAMDDDWADRVLKEREQFRVEIEKLMKIIDRALNALGAALAPEPEGK